MGLIFFASALPDPGAPPGGLSDKGAHVVAYAALGGTLVRALARGRSASMPPARIAAAAVLATLYGLTDELHQRFVPGRTPDLLDVAADAVGGIAGAVAVAVAARTWSSIRRSRLAHRRP